MIVRKSSKLHPELDMAAAASAFAEPPFEKQLSGKLADGPGFITSAWDLYSAETLRDRGNRRRGEAIPTDVFVFGKGEPEDPSCTKVGGRPFWPVDRDWPAAPDGSPCHFLAQFNFTDSVDIVGGKLPGMVLLLLTDSKESWIWDGGLSFHWVSSDIAPATKLTVPSAIGSSGPFYGVIYRTADYPDTAAEWGQYLSLLSATKIGGLPAFIQGGPDLQGDFLCELGSVQAADSAPYPWVNRQDPLGLNSTSDGIHAAENCAVFSDMGRIYLFIDCEGKVSHLFECY